VEVEDFVKAFFGIAVFTLLIYLPIRNNDNIPQSFPNALKSDRQIKKEEQKWRNDLQQMGRANAKYYFDQGMAHYTGKGAILSHEKALDSFESACNIGLQEGCNAYNKLIRCKNDYSGCGRNWIY
jgi:hypothetical protein